MSTSGLSFLSETARDSQMTRVRERQLYRQVKQNTDAQQ